MYFTQLILAYPQFVVDGTWTTDHTAPQEDDGHNNVNNVLIPDNIKKSSQHTDTEKAAGATLGGAAAAGGTAAVMPRVTPESTTAGLAGNVPKETKEGPGSAAISSAAPGSSTTEMAKDVPLEKKDSVPGAFPETPAGEREEVFSVNPIPASSGIGNPVQLEAGQKVPDPSTHTSNTVESTATTDKAGYEKDASAATAGLAAGSAGGALAAAEGEKGEGGAFSVPEKSKNMIPESSLPIGEGKDAEKDAGPTIQSAGPTSTTAALAGEVPKEPRGEAKTVDDEPPSATLSGPAPAVPEVVQESMAEAHQSPEAATNPEAVREKEEVESELLKDVKREEGSGEPAPTASAPTTETAPARTLAPKEQPKKIQDRDLSPMTKDPDAPAQPTVTTGVAGTKAPETSTPKKDATPATTTPQSASTNNSGSPATGDKKKKRASGFFGKLKQKLKS